MRDKTSPSSFKHQLEQNSLLLLNDDLADDFADENGHGMLEVMAKASGDKALSKSVKIFDKDCQNIIVLFQA